MGDKPGWAGEDYAAISQADLYEYAAKAFHSCAKRLTSIAVTEQQYFRRASPMLEA